MQTTAKHYAQLTTNPLARPEVIARFERRYGSGSWSRYLWGGWGK